MVGGSRLGGRLRVGSGATLVLVDGELAVVRAVLAAAGGDDRKPAQPAPDQLSGKPGAAPIQIPAGWAVHPNREVGVSLVSPGDGPVFDQCDLVEIPDRDSPESALLDAFAELFPCLAGDPTGITSASILAFPALAGASVADLAANAGEVIEQLSALGVETTVQSVLMPAGQALALEDEVRATPRTPNATIRQDIRIEWNTMFVLTLGSLNLTPAVDEQPRQIANRFRIL